jgi:hypothetical protein
MGAELFQEYGRTDGHDEASRFSQFCACTQKEKKKEQNYTRIQSCCVIRLCPLFDDNFSKRLCS